MVKRTEKPESYSYICKNPQEVEFVKARIGRVVAYYPQGGSGGMVSARVRKVDGNTIYLDKEIAELQ